MRVKYDLYIDESGDFNDARPNRPRPDELSMVGGILCDPSRLTPSRINSMFSGPVHCKNGYSKSFIKLLEDLKADRHRFIVFENTEQIKVINPQYTYINIISEGLVKLFRDLASLHPGGAYVNVIIAQRSLSLKEYRDRIIEKTRMAYGREHITGCTYDITIEDARYDKRLFIADIVCNTYLTRNRVDKFTADEQSRIAALFSPQDIYPVFEDATVSYIKQLLLDRHWGEVICQLCTLPYLKTLTAQRDILVRRLLRSTPKEREYYLGQISVELKLCEDQGLFEEGIALGENFKRYILDRLDKNESAQKESAFWRFDTDFHLLTMYDHLGNTHMIDVCLNACRANLEAVSTSWENLNYYFLFRIRELNTMMDLFQFEEVLEKAKQYQELFRETNALFDLVREQAGIPADGRSESLGKIEGIRLQAMTNLIARKPDLFQEAIATSDRALSEFTRPDDLIRQYGYRSKLMLEAGKPQDALKCIYRMADQIQAEGNAFEKLMAHIYREGFRPNYYLLLNYTGVMLALVEAEDPAGNDMAKTLIDNPRFYKDLKDRNKQGYPWNVILWQMAQYCRKSGHVSASDGYYKRAIAASEGNKEYITVLSFTAAMTAERLLHSADRSQTDKAEFERQWREANRSLNQKTVPASIRQWFSVDHPDITLQAVSAWK